MIIATGVNIPNTAFTNWFDQLLADMMLYTPSHVSGLRTLQVEMLETWRAESRNGANAPRDGTRTCLPSVWAYYQAHGVDQREMI